VSANIGGFEWNYFKLNIPLNWKSPDLEKEYWWDETIEDSKWLPNALSPWAYDRLKKTVTMSTYAITDSGTYLVSRAAIDRFDVTQVHEDCNPIAPILEENFCRAGLCFMVDNPAFWSFDRDTKVILHGQHSPLGVRVVHLPSKFVDWSGLSRGQREFVVYKYVSFVPRLKI